MQSQNRDFWPAEDVAAVMTAYIQAALYCSLGYVRMYKNKEVHFEKQNKYRVPPQMPVFCVSLILNTRSDLFEVFLALDPTLKFWNSELSQHWNFSEYFTNCI